MPTISSFYGVLIRMHWNEHVPPHFHAIYGEHEAVIRIDSPELIRGSLPRRAQMLTLEWAAARRSELMENWELCANKRQPKLIPPLE